MKSVTQRIIEASEVIKALEQEVIKLRAEHAKSEETMNAASKVIQSLQLQVSALENELRIEMKSTCANPCGSCNACCGLDTDGKTKLVPE